MAPTVKSKKKRERQGVSSRFAIFTFSRDLNLHIGNNGVSALRGILKKRSTKSIKDACPSGERDGKTEAEYKSLDKEILPHITLYVFFENFSHPELIFAETNKISINAKNHHPNFVSARITNFALWESDYGDDWKNLCLTVEAEFRLSIVDGVDVENPYDCSDSEIEEQLFECENMFNIHFEGIEYEDEDEDEALQNSWVARFV